MTTLAAPSVNEGQNTLAASFTRGTDTTIVLVDGTIFPSPTPLGHVVRIANTANTKWCDVIYTSKATNTLTMGGGATDYALAKNVTVGDEAYEWPIGSTVELVCAADEIGQLFSDAEDALHQPGHADWENRSYEGYEVVDTATTYTIGSGKDFETFTAAAAALKELILVANITLQLDDTFTESTMPSFNGIVSSGGSLRIDLHGEVWSYDGTDTYCMEFSGPMRIYIWDSLTGGGSLKCTSGSLAPPYDFLGVTGSSLEIRTTATIDCNDKALRSAIALLYFAHAYLQNPSYGDVTELTAAIIRMDGGSVLTTATAEPASVQIVASGSVWRKINGDFFGSAGLVGP